MKATQRKVQKAAFFEPLFSSERKPFADLGEITLKPQPVPPDGW
jgi:hypothetical protein